MIAVEWHARPLAQVARPARGRTPARYVGFTIAPRHVLRRAGRQLGELLRQGAGPTRCSQVIVQPAFDVEHAALLLSSPLMADVSAARLNALLAEYEASPARSVLLIGFCRVLWPQNSRSVDFS